MSDHELYRRWMSGDSKAGGQLFAAHWQELRRYIEARVQADMVGDISQASWLEAQRLGGYRGEGPFIGWMKAIARSQIARQKEARQAGLEPDEGTSPSRHVLRREAADLLEDISHEGVRASMSMFWLEGMPVAAIAGATGAPEKTVRSRLRLGLRWMRGHI